MLSLGIPNARGHRQSLCPLPTYPSFFFSPPLDWHMCIGICFVDFPQHAVPICLVGLSFPSLSLPLTLSLSLSHCLPSCLPWLVLRFKHGARSFPTKRSGQHLHLHFHLHLQLHLRFSILHFSLPSSSTYSDGTCPGCLFMHDLIADWHRHGLQPPTSLAPRSSPALLYSCIRYWCFLPSIFFESSQTKVNCLTLNYENDRRHDMREKVRELRQHVLPLACQYCVPCKL